MAPDMFKEYIQYLRNAFYALTNRISNNLSPDEAGVQKRARRSIFASRDLEPGEIISR